MYGSHIAQELADSVPVYREGDDIVFGMIAVKK